MEKTLKNWHTLDDKEKKRWLTIKQLPLVFIKLFHQDTLSLIVKDDRIKRKHFFIQSEEYKWWLKNGSGTFYGVKYTTDQFYLKDSVEAVIDEYKEGGWETHTRHTSFKHQKHMKQYFNDQRALRNPTQFVPTEFYGDEVQALRDMDFSNHYRLYSGLFMNYAYIKKIFCEINDKMSPDILDAVLFLFNHKFFLRGDLYGFYFNTKKIFAPLDDEGKDKYGKIGGQYKLFMWLVDDGWVEKVDLSKSDVYGKNKVYSRNRIWRTTDKADKICSDFMDYILYKRKLPYIGKGWNEEVLTVKDHKKRDHHSDKTYPYHFYSSTYEYVNTHAESRFFDGDELEFFKRMSSADFPYTPSIYLVTELRYMNEGFEDSANRAYIKRFLNTPRFGLKQ